ncbi:hypothetical protein [Hymenobacter lapidarius]|uniref:hypothetical protein n=1 Tax=Hymenobacter lapidarius TaxID=1908237 RepID=UPI000F790863|nr:hypothetical protein [Hymenobacter lapidarius]
MKRYLLLALVLYAGSVQAQVSVLVNPEGTHSVIHQNGNSGVVVNPNGTHSILTQTGNTAIITNSNGTTTVIPDLSANPTVIVNADGTHSVLHRNGNTAVLVGPGGKHKLLGPAISDTSTTYGIRLLRLLNKLKF